MPPREIWKRPVRSRRLIPELQSQDFSESSEAEVMEDDLEPAEPSPILNSPVQICEEPNSTDLRRHLEDKFVDEIPIGDGLRRPQES